MIRLPESRLGLTIGLAVAAVLAMALILAYGCL